MTGWQIVGVVAGVLAAVLLVSGCCGVLIGKFVKAGRGPDDLHEGATQREHEDPVFQAWTAPVPDLGSLDYRAPGGES